MLQKLELMLLGEVSRTAGRPENGSRFELVACIATDWRSEVPLPRWLARFNKRTFNKMEIKRGIRPVLSHVGRSSGKTYETPLDAHEVEGGYIFIANYGRDSDWVKNILAAGRATVRVEGAEIALMSPRMISKDEAQQQMAAQTKWPPDLMNVTECLRMDVDR